VESNTIHPVGKAIVEAARAASCTSVKVYMHLVEVFHVIILGKHGNKDEMCVLEQYGYIKNDSSENYR